MVTGIGGVFIKAKDPAFLARWYEDYLGIGFGKSPYFTFKWRSFSGPEDVCVTDLSFFKQDTDYFEPGKNELMLNLRVDNLDDIRIRLKQEGVTVIDRVESFEYGRFGWILDAERNKIELWEPNDEAFGNLEEPMQLNKVSGLGGGFIKCHQVESMLAWYSSKLGIFFKDTTHVFRWKDLRDRKHTGHTVFSFFPESSTYFAPSAKPYMLNLRVNDLDAILKDLREMEVELPGKKEEYAYGKFAWLIDPEGNKVELWEPVDEYMED
jgi:predicted enzyme related to lactoylglutathione lyase